MSVIKQIVAMGEKALTGTKKAGSANYWTKMKNAYNKNKASGGGIHSMNVMTLHERNGTRGDGIGMGHRNQQGKNR